MFWRYVAFNNKFVKEIKGVHQGTYQSILLDLQHRNLKVISIYPDVLTTINQHLTSRKLTLKEMAVFFDDFSNMLGTGLTLPHILNLLREQTLNSQFAAVYVEMNKNLSKGESLSSCFKASGKFPDLVISVLSAGEVAGHLPLTMKILSEYYEVLNDMKGRILGSMVTPVITINILLALLVYLSIKVIPNIKTILPSEALNNSLTQFMLNLSVFLQNYWILLLIFPFLFWGLVIYLKHVLKDEFDSLIFKIPYVGCILRDYEISIIFLSIWVLQRAGVSIDVALRKTIEANKSYASKQLEGCRMLLVSGNSLSQAIKQNSFFPNLISETIRFGEEMGKYDEYFERVYKVYRRSFLKRSHILIELIKPAMLLFSGIFILAILYAFLQPIYGNLMNIGVSTMK